LEQQYVRDAQGKKPSSISLYTKGRVSL